MTDVFQLQCLASVTRGIVTEHESKCDYAPTTCSSADCLEQLLRKGMTLVSKVPPLRLCIIALTDRSSPHRPQQTSRIVSLQANFMCPGLWSPYEGRRCSGAFCRLSPVSIEVHTLWSRDASQRSRYTLFELHIQVDLSLR